MKIILTLLLVLITRLSFSQSDDFSYKIGTPHSLNYYGNVFSKDNKVLSIKKTKKEIIMQLFDGETMNEIKQKPLEIDFDYDSYTIHQMGEHFYMFYQKWDRKAGNEQLFVREIDFDNCSLKGSSKLLVKLDRKIVGGKFKYEFSNDQKTLMLWCRTVPDSRIDAINKDIIGMYTFDLELNNISSGSYQMPYTEAVMNNISYTVDAAGNAYILTEVLLDPKEKKILKNGDLNYRLELVKVNTEGNVSNAHLNTLDKRLLDLKFEEGKNNELSIVGFYSNSIKGNVQDGIFFSKIIDDEVADYSYYDFPSDVIKKYLSVKNKKNKKEKENEEDESTAMSLRNYRVRSINHDDQGVTIFIEYYLHTTYRDSKTNTVTHYYSFGDIIGLRIDQNGGLVWMNKFPKNQSGVNSTVSLGFKHMSDEEHNYLIFMDTKFNSELQVDQYPSIYNGGAGVLTGFKIDKTTGEFERLSILNFEEVDVDGKKIINFSPNDIISLNPEEFVTECGLRKSKSKVMIKVKLE